MIPTAGAHKKTHTYTAAGNEVTHTFSGFRRLSTVCPPQRNYTLHIDPTRRQGGHQGDRGHTDSPSECDSDTVRVKSGIIRLVRVKSDERERENQVGVQEHRKIGECVGGVRL